jgi:pimeloyl-ACP methyl ester carboxylesterase
MAHAGYEERRYTSKDGLSLFYRDYAGPGTKALPVLCIPGLTRNSKDFDFIAAAIARTRRVLTVDLRGRGQSAYDPNPANYSVPAETKDVLLLLDLLGLAKAVILGTSRGGVIAMTMAAFRPGIVAAAILNDMGAQLEPEGLERIYAVMRAPPSHPGWQEATDALKRANAKEFPGVSDARWKEFAHALYRERDGRIVGDYDPKFPQAILDGRGTNPRDEKGAADLWKWFDALTSVPVLVLRGEKSELLSAGTLAAMSRKKPDLAVATIFNRGHVPFLDEPEAVAAIDAFLSRLP